MKHRKKKVLVISRDFLPSSKSSVRRILGICNVLESNPSIELTLLTSGSPSAIDEKFKIIRVNPYGKKKSSESIFNTKNRSQIPLFEKDTFFWVPKVFMRIFMKQFDVIYCSVPPFSVMILGCLLKITRLFRPFKLVIEYRDLVGFNPQSIENLSKKIHQKIEILVLRFSNTVIVTTNGMKNTLGKRINTEKITVIRNYMSLNEFKTVKNIKPLTLDDSYFHIGYVGILSTGRNPKILFSLVNYSINDKPIKLHLVGINMNSQIYLREKYHHLPNFSQIIFHDRVTREDSLKYIKSFDAATFLINPNVSITEGYGIPGKIYDYMLVAKSTIADEASCKNLKTDLDLTMLDFVPGYKKIVFSEHYFLDDKLRQMKLFF